MELKNTKTEKNLLEAFLGESGARNKYDYFSSRAKKDGFELVSAIFAETALNEKEHAKLWFKELTGGVKDTYQNLLTSAAGEKEEYSNMYKRMAKEAKEEGFDELAKKFEGVAKIEESHEKRYLKLAKMIENNTMFNDDKIVIWRCRNCGHIHLGKYAPKECPVCNHPQAYFERVLE